MTVRVGRVLLSDALVQCTRMGNRSSRAVAAEVALGKQFYLFVVCVACHRAGGAYPTRNRAGQAEVHSLSDWPHIISAFRELVWQHQRGLLNQLVLRIDQVIEGACHTALATWGVKEY